MKKPDQRVAYIGAQGSRVRVQRGRIIVESKDEATLLDVPQTKVERVVCYGSVGVTAGLRSWATEQGVDIVLASRRGQYIGQIIGANRAPKAERLRAQIAFTDSPAALTLAQSIVEAKVRKQIVILQRFGRRSHAGLTRPAIAQMRSSLAFLPECTSRAEVMGIEGAAARSYFEVFGQLFPEELRFDLRSRRPPQNVANAALSFGYALLEPECDTALYACGLEPCLGSLHADKGRRPSLALDLMEEFRPMVVDQVVLQLARSRALTPASGRRIDAKGVHLTKAGREAVVDGYERRLLRSTRGALDGFEGSLRRHIYRQAQRMAATIMAPDNAPAWTGLSWR